MLERGTRTHEYLLPAGICIVVAAAGVRIGLGLAVGAVALACIFLGALSSPVALAVAILTLGPLPSTESLVGVTFPFGLDPLNVLVVIGIGAALIARRQFPLRGERGLLRALSLVLLLFGVSWWRTYGGAPSADSISLLAKPFVTVAAAALLVSVLPRRQLRVVPLAMAGMLLAVAASIVLQRMGLYTTGQQTARAAELGAKQFGGLMLDGNTAGTFFGIFAIPVYALVSAHGHRRLAIAVVVTAVPILLITLSRSGMVGFVVGLVALTLVDRRSLGGLRTLVGVGAFALVWGATIGHGYVTQIADSVAGYQTDANAATSGREAIWSQVLVFLHGRWLTGGGLDSFRQFALQSPLQHGFATHDTALKLLTDGGVGYAAAVAALVWSLWRLGSGDAFGRALRIAVVSFVAVGITLEVDLLGRVLTWLWVFAAVVAAQRSAVRAAATNRSAIGPTLQGLSGLRIASRMSGDVT